MDFESNCRGVQPSCFLSHTITSPFGEEFKEFLPSESYMQDCNAKEEQLRLPMKQKSARKISRKFSRARPLTEEELDHKRVTANVQERRRMQRLNTALEKLKHAIPQHLHMQYRRLSKIKTLKLAIDYIGYLEEVLNPNLELQFCANGPQMQVYETKNANAFNFEVCAHSDVVLEEQGFVENEGPNPRSVTSDVSASGNCVDALQQVQCNSYFLDITVPQENEGFHYLEQF